MKFTQRTILGLFDSSKKQLVIPVYQRAYSWEMFEWRYFIEDLEEQVKGENKYYYGNLLLETIKIDKEYEIIDGQQRITTITINQLQHQQKQTQTIQRWNPYWGRTYLFSQRTYQWYCYCSKRTRYKCLFFPWYADPRFLRRYARRNSQRFF